MAGGIQKVRFLENFRPDLRGARFLARMKSKDDDALLRGVAEELESEGIKSFGFNPLFVSDRCF